MTGLAHRYLDLARVHLDALRERSGGAIDEAGRFTAERLVSGGRLHHFDTGHCAREPVRRAGGLVGLHAIEVSYALDHDTPPGRPDAGLAKDYFYDNESMGSMVAERAALASGDVLWLVSNSGKEPFPVALALGAKSRGVAVVALTSVAFSKSLEARHSSGRRLYEVADRVVDLGAPLEDAAVAAPGLPTPIAPLSGLLTVAATWALEAATVEALLSKGVVPAVYRSVNLPDGFAKNAEAERAYRARGI